MNQKILELEVQELKIVNKQRKTTHFKNKTVHALHST